MRKSEILNAGSENKEPYMTVKQASEYISVSTACIYNLVWNQKLKPYKLGGGKRPRLRFTKSQLDKFLGGQNGN